MIFVTCVNFDCSTFNLLIINANNLINYFQCRLNVKIKNLSEISTIPNRMLATEVWCAFEFPSNPSSSCFTNLASCISRFCSSILCCLYLRTSLAESISSLFSFLKWGEKDLLSFCRMTGTVTLRGGLKGRVVSKRLDRDKSQMVLILGILRGEKGTGEMLFSSYFQLISNKYEYLSGFEKFCQTFEYFLWD